LPELNLEGIKLENIVIEADDGLACIDANGVNVKGMKLILEDSSSLQFINSQNIDIEKLDITGNPQPSVAINGGKSKNITIKYINPGKTIKTVIGNEVDRKTLYVQ
jgi:DNA sulfur modification protein DndE